MTEDKMVGWYYQLNGRKFEPVSGDGDGQGSLACCSPWGHRVLTAPEQQQTTFVFTLPGGGGLLANSKSASRGQC